MADKRRAPAREPANYRRLAGNTVATLVGRAGAVGLALLLSTVLFRTLGPELFGLWSLFAFLVGYSALVDFGLSAAVERQIARLHSTGRAPEIPATIGQALLLVLVAACALEVLVTAGSLVVEWWGGAPVSPEIERGLAVLPAALALMTGSLVVGGGLSGLQRMVALYAWRTGGMIVGTAAASACAVAGVRRLDVLLLAYAAGAPLVGAGQWWSLKRVLRAEGWRGGRIAWRQQRASLGELLRFGGALQAATIGPMIGDYAFRLIVSRRFGVEYAGIYDLSARAALGLRSLGSSLFVAMVPFGVSLLASGDRRQAERLVRLTVKYTGLLMLPCSMLLVVVAEPLVLIWLGADPGTRLVTATFRPLVILHAAVSLTVPMTMIGRSAGLPGPEAIITWAAVATAIAFSALVPGFQAAVVVYALLPLVSGAVLWWWLARRLGVGFDGWRDVLVTGAVAFAAGAAGFGARSAAESMGASPVAVIFAAAIAWAAVVLPAGAKLKLIGSREWEVLKGLGDGQPVVP